MSPGPIHGWLIRAATIAFGLIFMLSQVMAQSTPLCNLTTGLADENPPQPILGAFCAPGQEVFKGPAPEITLIFPRQLSDVIVSNVHQTGIPFYVQGKDVDWLYQTCSQTTKRYKKLDVSDRMSYRFSIAQMDLPSKGHFQAGSQLADVVDHPAAVYWLPADLAPRAQPYTFRVTCTWRDAGLPLRAKDHVDANNQTIVWELVWCLTVIARSECVAELISMTAPTLPMPMPPGPVTITQDEPCCQVNPYLSRGLLPSSVPTDTYLPSSVGGGRYVALMARYADFDFFHRICEDVPGVGGGQSVSDSDHECIDNQGATRDHLSLEDAVEYLWTCQPPPQSSGGLVVTAWPPGVGNDPCEYTTILFADIAGQYDLCVQVKSGLDPDPNVVIANLAIQASVAAGPNIVLKGAGPLLQQSDTLAQGCGHIRLYVNDDDDDANGYADNDNHSAASLSGEDDMYRLEVESVGPVPLQIQLRVQGEPNLRVFTDSSHSTPATGWLSFGAPFAVYLEGLQKSSALRQTQLLVDVRYVVNGPVETLVVDATVFGVTYVGYAAGLPGHGLLHDWTNRYDGTNMPAGEMPTGLEIAARSASDNRASLGVYYDSGADPMLDVRSPSGEWTELRSILKGVATVSPQYPLRLYLDVKDVDDISHPVYSGAGSRARNFFDVDFLCPEAGAPQGNGGVTYIQRDDNRTTVGAISVTGSLVFGHDRETECDLSGNASFLIQAPIDPGDNIRVIASLAESPSRLLAAQPGDWPLPDPVTSESAHERDAAVIYPRIDPIDAPQCLLTPGALMVPSVVRKNMSYAPGTQTLASLPATVVRRVHVEVVGTPSTAPLSSDVAMASNLCLTVDGGGAGALEDNSRIPYTRYIVSITPAGAGNLAQDQIVEFAGRTGPLSLRRRSRDGVWLTVASPDVFLGDSEGSPDGSNAPLPLPPYLGSVPVPLADEVGPLSNGRLWFQAVGAQPIATSGEQALCIKGYGQPLQRRLRIPLVAIIAGAPQQNVMFDQMTPGPGGVVVLGLSPTLGEAIPPGAGEQATRVRVAYGPGVGEFVEGVVTASTVDSLTIAVGPLGVSFRIPCLLFDDTAWELCTSASQEETLDINQTAQKVTNGLTEEVRILQALYRDSCIAFAPTSALGWGPAELPSWRKHIPLLWIGAEPVSPMALYEHISALMHVTWAHYSVIQERIVKADQNMWACCCIDNRDGYSWLAPAGEVARGNGDQWAGEYPLSGCNFVWLYSQSPSVCVPMMQMSSWQAREMARHQLQVEPDALYQMHSWSNIQNWKMLRMLILAHELGHYFLGRESEGVSVVVSLDRQYHLYDGVALDAHSIPGLMRDLSVADPVVGGVIAGIYDWSRPPTIGPYMLRRIRDVNRILGFRF